jgi:hypothetical protein
VHSCSHSPRTDFGRFSVRTGVFAGFLTDFGQFSVRTGVFAGFLTDYWRFSVRTGVFAGFLTDFGQLSVSMADSPADRERCSRFPHEISTVSAVLCQLPIFTYFSRIFVSPKN